jgi:hypothetical protein
LHNEFPDHFYEPGNLFGSYLGGKAPPSTWDLKHELELEGLGIPVKPPNRLYPGRGKASRQARKEPVTTPEPQPRAHIEALRAFVYLHMDSDETLGAFRTVAAWKGYRVRAELKQDPRALFHGFALRFLSDHECEQVLAALKSTRRDRDKPRRPTIRPSTKRRAKPSGAEINRPRLARSGEDRSRPRPQPAQDLVCALCGAKVGDEDRERCSESYAIFQGQVYCDAHRVAVERVLAR